MRCGWHPPLVRRLEELAGSGLRASVIAKMMNAEFELELSVYAVRQKAWNEGITLRGKAKQWWEDEKPFRPKAK